MRLANVQPGDTIEVDVRGHVFPAKVLDLNCPDIPGQPIRVEPLVPVTFFHLKASQIRERLDPPPRAHRRRAA